MNDATEVPASKRQENFAERIRNAIQIDIVFVNVVFFVLGESFNQISF